MTGNLFSAIAARLPADRGRWFAALPERGPGHPGHHYTYQDVLDVSARFANVLAGLGVAPGDRVAVQAEKSIEGLMLYLGAVRAGAVYLPINPASTADETAYVLDDAEPAVFVCDPERAEALAPIAGRVGAKLETLDGWQHPDIIGGSLAEKGLAAGTAFADAARAGDDLAAILYTSGTTGRPKGAMLTHANLTSNAEALVETWRFTRDDVLLHALPIFHTHGLFTATNTALFAGARMILLSRFDPDRVIVQMPHTSVFMGVPTFYTRLLSEPRLTRDLAAPMRLFVSGSAPLLPDTHAAFRARTGHAILERYGMTETSMIASNPYEGERRPGAVGFALPGTEVRIAHPGEDGPLPGGQTGGIEVKGPNVFRGYWRAPTKTDEAFRPDGFFVTGDLGRLDADGYLHIVGRAKDLVISGGLNVYPKEVEAAIDALPGVVESAVIGAPHADLGEGVVAVVVPGGKQAPDEAALLAMLKDRLAGYKVPKRLVFADELPRNTMGKVRKDELRQRFADVFDAAPDGVPRASP